MPVDRPVSQPARKSFSSPLGSGEVLGVDNVDDASLDVAKQDTHTLVSNERASECLDAFRSPPSRSVILQRVAYECGLALQFVQV